MLTPVMGSCFTIDSAITTELRWLLIGFAIGIFGVSIIVAVLILAFGNKAVEENKAQKSDLPIWLSKESAESNSNSS